MIKSVSVFDKTVIKEGMEINCKTNLVEFVGVVTRVDDFVITCDDVNNSDDYDIRISINDVLRGKAMITILDQN